MTLIDRPGENNRHYDLETAPGGDRVPAGGSKLLLVFLLILFVFGIFKNFNLYYSFV